MRRQSDSPSLQTVDNCFDIIEALKELDGARVTEVADHVGLSKSSVHKHLITLKRRGYVTMESDEYYVSLRFSNLAEYAKYRTASRRKLFQFSKSLPEFAGLQVGVIIEENGRGSYLKPELDENPFTGPQAGSRVYLHGTAAGKAILATLPEETVDRIVDIWGLPQLTSQTITDRETLRAELKSIRSNEFAFNNGENNEGIRAIGTAITDSNDTTLGAISVGGPQYRIDDTWFEEELPYDLLDRVEEFEREL
ncbi:IclR family transcriptional regulator [Natrarchaeobius chitinivorans]|nr:IclR family transcriptional regulator [Natrarchaeobius chitinivorans]